MKGGREKKRKWGCADRIMRQGVGCRSLIDKQKTRRDSAQGPGINSSSRNNYDAPQIILASPAVSLDLRRLTRGPLVDRTSMSFPDFLMGSSRPLTPRLEVIIGTNFMITKF